MKWTITCADVALTYTSITWERDCGGVKQTLTVMAWNNDEMDLYARAVWNQMSMYRSIEGHTRSYIHLDGDVSSYFNKTLFQGDETTTGETK